MLIRIDRLGFVPYFLREVLDVKHVVIDEFFSLFGVRVIQLTHLCRYTIS